MSKISAQPSKIILVGETASLSLTASGMDLEFVWTAERGEITSAGWPSATYTAPDSPGPDTVTVEVTGKGGSTYQSITFQVEPLPTAIPTETPVPSPTSIPTLTPVPTPASTATPAPTLTPVPNPLVDTESLTGWREDFVHSEGESSLNALMLVPGRTGNAVGITYDLGEEGFVIITKGLDPGVLTGTTGISFYYKGSGAPNTLEFKLMLRYPGDDDDTTYGVTWSRATDTGDSWEQLKVRYSDFTCWWPAENCEKRGDRPDVMVVDRLDFAVSNKPGDETGSGEVVFDDVLGILD